LDPDPHRSPDEGEVMTEEPVKDERQTGEPTPGDDAITKLRNEFQEQFSTLKTTFETENKKNLDLIDKLTKENEDLHRALIRSAQMPPAEPAPQKTEEELYAERIIELSKKSKMIEKRNRGIFDAD